ncbi:uncharacterized protein LOC114438654 isoform X2 [Parambassis ranga]|nr:uncharacterized protein LOC114438654 isoform X2 [Parambassis ranga]
MDVLSKLEVYIPVEAEVKCIPLHSLPNSVRRRIGLPLSDSKSLTDHPNGIWICPAIIRKKGQKSPSHTDSSVGENLSSALGTEVRTKPGPFRMAFVASNHAAYTVLKDIPGTTASQAAPLPHGSAPRVNQDSLVIYRGRIYLSIKKHSQSQNQREPGSSCSAVSSTSDVSSKSQKDLPKSKKTHSSSKVMHHGNKEKVTHKGDASSSVHSQPTVTASSQCHKDTKEEPASEPEEDETPELCAGDAEDTGIDMQTESREVDQRRISTEFLGAAGTYTSAQKNFDFNALEQEEKIARLRAILRQDEAAVKNLPSYK